MTDRDRDIIADIYHNGITHADLKGLERMNKKRTGFTYKKISPELIIELLDITEECYKNGGNCFDFSVNLSSDVKIRYSIGFQFVDAN